MLGEVSSAQIKKYKVVLKKLVEFEISQKRKYKLSELNLASFLTRVTTIKI